MRSAALTLASNTIDLSRYTRIVLGFPASSCNFGGLADIGCNAADAIVPHPLRLGVDLLAGAVEAKVVLVLCRHPVLAHFAIVLWEQQIGVDLIAKLRREVHEAVENVNYLGRRSLLIILVSRAADAVVVWAAVAGTGYLWSSPEALICEVAGAMCWAVRGPWWVDDEF